MPPPARPVPEEILEEILLRLPPHKPAYLVRASAVSKPWLALISGDRFNGRYREFHGAPPMLGFLKSNPWDCWGPEDPNPPFVSTTGFRARIPDDGWGHRDYGVWDCRHGRVLLGEKKAAPMKLAVWDPITGHRREIQEPSCMVLDHKGAGYLAAAVLCAVASCDHLACHDGPFKVVFFSLNFADAGNFVAQVCTSLPETGKPLSSDFHLGEWSQPCPALPIDTRGFIEPNPPVLVKDAVHFMLAYEHEYDEYNWDMARLQILKYDLTSSCLSLIDGPPRAPRHYGGHSMIMALEDGSLGFVRIKRLHLHIWSRQMGSDTVAAWTGHRVINLKNIPPIIDHKGFLSLLGSVEGRDTIFVYTNAGTYKINLKTLQRKKIWEGEHFNALIPYMSFYNPLERVGAFEVDG